MATVTERLALLITANSAGAVKGLRDVAAASREMAGATGASEKELRALEARAGAARSTLASGLGIPALQSRLATLGPLGQKAAGGIGNIVTAAESLGPASLAASAASVVAFAAVAKVTADGVKVFQDWASQARVVKAATGATAEQASGLAAVMRALGVDVTSGARSFGILATNVTHHREILTSEGVAIARNKQGYVDLEGTLLNLADRYKQMVAAGNTAGARSLAKGALGRGFAELTPLLAQGRDGLKEFFDEARRHHEILSQKDLDDARELAIRGRELTGAWQGFEVQLARNVVPALIGLTDWLTHAIEKVDELITKLPRLVPPSGGPAERFSKELNKTQGKGKNDPLAQILGGADDVQAAQAARDLAAGTVEARVAMEARAKWEKKATDIVQTAISADREAASAAHGVAVANRGVRDAERAVTDAVRGVRDAREHLNDVLKQGEEVTHRITEAQRALAESDQDVADAQEAVAKAQDKINKLRAGPSEKDRHKADLAVREAQAGVADANQQAAAAEKRLRDLRAGAAGTGGNRFASTASPEDIAAAELDVQQAQLAVEQSALTLSDAQDDLNKLMDAGKDGSDELKDAQKDLRDAERNLADQVYRHGEAQRALNQANDGVAAHEREIRDAREGLASATQNVAAAHEHVRDAQYQAAAARDAYSQAILNAQKAHETENHLIDQGVTGLLLYKAELEGLAQQSPALAAAIQPILSNVIKLLNAAASAGRFAGLSDAVLAGGVPVFAAYGDIYDRPTVATFGEDGDEMVVPLTKPATAARLIRKAIAMYPGVGQAMTHMGNGAIIRSGGLPSGLWRSANATVSHQSVMFAPTIEVNAGVVARPDELERLIVDSLVRANKKMGALPFRTSGRAGS